MQPQRCRLLLLRLLMPATAGMLHGVTCWQRVALR
jgi:hypothetical protein